MTERGVKSEWGVRKRERERERERINRVKRTKIRLHDLIRMSILSQHRPVILSREELVANEVIEEREGGIVTADEGGEEKERREEREVRNEERREERRKMRVKNIDSRGKERKKNKRKEKGRTRQMMTRSE